MIGQRHGSALPPGLGSGPGILSQLVAVARLDRGEQLRRPTENAGNGPFLARISRGRLEGVIGQADAGTPVVIDHHAGQIALAGVDEHPARSKVTVTTLSGWWF